MSEPAQETVNEVPDCVGLSEFTWLAGAVLSIALDQVAVLMGAFASKPIVAVFCMTVPVLTLDLGATVKKTLPSEPGGRKPARGSAGGWFVTGSRDWKTQLTTPVATSAEALILTRRFVVGRRSTIVVKGDCASGIEGGVTTRFENALGPKVSVVRSRLALRLSVTVTAWAGAVAVGILANSISYGSGVAPEIYC